MAVSIEQASLNALAAWISSQLDPGIIVAARWPSPDRKLPPRAITIIPAGSRDDEHLDLRLINAADIDSTNANMTWQVKMCRQPIQIDVWANTDPDRDDLLAQLDQILNVGAVPLGTVQDPAESGVLVQVADGWLNTTADFTFEGPRRDDEPDSVARSEYRATISGTAYVMLTVTRASAKQTTIIFKQKLTESDTDFDLTTITGSGVTHGVGP